MHCVVVVFLQRLDTLIQASDNIFKKGYYNNYDNNEFQSQILNSKIDIKKFISTILFNHKDLNINDFKIKDLKNNKSFKVKFK